jgi:hypothetical protein
MLLRRALPRSFTVLIRILLTSELCNIVVAWSHVSVTLVFDT